MPAVRKWVYDQAIRHALASAFTTTSPQTILDAPGQYGSGPRSTFRTLKTPGEARRASARPPVGAGMHGDINALTDALGDEVIRRAPTVNADTMYASMEWGSPRERDSRLISRGRKEKKENDIWLSFGDVIAAF